MLGHGIFHVTAEKPKGRSKAHRPKRANSREKAISLNMRDLPIGEPIGLWRVVEKRPDKIYTYGNGKKSVHSRYWCRCVCGTEREVDGYTLVQGGTSCGCLQRASVTMYLPYREDDGSIKEYSLTELADKTGVPFLTLRKRRQGLTSITADAVREICQVPVTQTVNGVAVSKWVTKRAPELGRSVAGLYDTFFRDRNILRDAGVEIPADIDETWFNEQVARVKAELKALKKESKNASL